MGFADRSARRALAAAVASALTMVMVIATGSSGAAPVARAAASCPPPKYPSVGYFDRLNVTGVSCATGTRLALAYYHCRTHSGNKAGRCAGGVLGYRCREVRNAQSVEIIGRVTCRRRGATVVHVYQQDL